VLYKPEEDLGKDENQNPVRRKEFELNLIYTSKNILIIQANRRIMFEEIL
jgi:hypothetical protein